MIGVIIDNERRRPPNLIRPMSHFSALPPSLRGRDPRLQRTGLPRSSDPQFKFVAGTEVPQPRGRPARMHAVGETRLQFLGVKTMARMAKEKENEAKAKKKNRASDGVMAVIIIESALQFARPEEEEEEGRIRAGMGASANMDWRYSI